MEEADDMEEVIVIYRLKKDSEERDGIAWKSNIDGVHNKRVLIDEAAVMMLATSYGLNKNTN